jgi:hypothetical protein
MSWIRSLLTILAAAFALALGPSVSWGWGDGGHMSIALRAWDEMTPQTRAAAISLLKQHPRYPLDFAIRMPPGLDPQEQDKWILTCAATWPDHIWALRITNPKDFQKYFHASWHIIGEPVALDPDQQATMPVLPWVSSADLNKLTIREALPLEIKTLSDTSLPAADRAVALCWVIHLIGDLHEPCHAASLFSNRFKPPEGDKVATRFSVIIDGKTTGMHQFWDSLYCSSGDFKVVEKWDQDQLDNPALQRSTLPQLAKDTTVDSWIAESFAIAKVDVYDNAVRAAIAAQDADPAVKFKPFVLSDAYIARARQIGRQRGVLAGLRLADTLSKATW